VKLPFRYLHVSIFAFLLLCVPLLLFWHKGSNLSNRKLTPFPSVSPAALLDRNFYSQLGDFADDHLPLKNSLLTLRSALYVDLLYTSTTPDVRLGNERGWFVHRNSLRLPCESAENISAQELGARLGRFARLLHSRGKRVLFSGAPQKATIYPEMLQSSDREEYACALERLSELRAVLDAKHTDYWLDPWPAFERETQADEEKTMTEQDYLSLARDSHWSDRGALLVSKMLVEWAHAGAWDPNSVQTRTVMKIGDLSRKLGYNVRTYITDVKVVRPGVKLKTSRQRAGSNFIRTFSATSDSKVLLPPLVVFHDSYALALLHQIPPYFEKTIFIHFGAVDSDLARETVRHADLVFVLVAERFMYSLLAKIDRTDIAALYEPLPLRPNSNTNQTIHPAE
jgi:hypothetical protein